MEVTGNNTYIPQTQYGSSVEPAVNNNGYAKPAANSPLQNQVNGAPAQPQQPATQTMSQTQPYYYPPQINVPANASGVNIQIFNPSVATPGAEAHTNVNSPNYYCYPSNYYTNQMNGGNMSNPYNTQNGNTSGGGAAGTVPTNNNPANGNNNVNGNENNSSSQSTTTTQTTENGSPKTEKKRIVVLNDNYIKNLEDMLNSKSKDDRVNAAKQVFERLDEDPSRKDDKALTSLVNKMLQDPSQEVRLLALAALEGRICNGNQLTVQLLEQMRTNPKDYGFDSNDAGRILLDMSAQKADKQVPVDPDKRTTVKKEEKKEQKEDKKTSQVKSDNK